MIGRDAPGSILVISSCTAAKVASQNGGLTLGDFRNPIARKRREEALTRYAHPAAELYTGMQHRYLMGGVERLRRRYGAAAASVKIISAGYGLVDEGRLLVPYNASFDEMSRVEARAWAETLGIASAVRKTLIAQRLIVMLLGGRYLEAIDPPLVPANGQRIIFLARADMKRRLQAPGVTVVTVGKTEAARYHAGYVALKGRMFELFAGGLVADPSLWQEVHEDGSSRAFLRAVSRGVNAR